MFAAFLPWVRRDKLMRNQECCWPSPLNLDLRKDKSNAPEPTKRRRTAAGKGFNSQLLAERRFLQDFDLRLAFQVSHEVKSLDVGSLVHLENRLACRIYKHVKCICLDIGYR